VVGVAAVLGLVGVVLNQVFIWPQVWRARHDVQGVAPLTALAGLLARSAWLVYGAVIGDVALVVGNVTVAVGFAILLVLLARAQRRLAGRLAASAGLVLAAVALTALSRPALAVLAVVSAAVVNLPQMARALADRRRLAGVSATTYFLIAAASTCWLLYGIVVGDLVISAPHFLLLPTAVVTALVARAQTPAGSSSTFVQPPARRSNSR
jgi:uncharacterized protein with PQ loop repeat